MVLLLMFFCVIVVLNIYSGNLTAFLSIPQMEKPINDLEDLLDRQEAMPTLREGGSYHIFIKVSSSRHSL